MARVARLFPRLDELERKYRMLLVKACRDQLEHRFSNVAVRTLRPGLFDGKFWRDEEAAHLENLEKEIRGLRRKLLLPFSESPVSELEHLRDVLRSRSDGECRRLLRDFIDRQSQAVDRAI